MVLQQVFSWITTPQKGPILQLFAPILLLIFPILLLIGEPRAPWPLSSLRLWETTLYLNNQLQNNFTLIRTVLQICFIIGESSETMNMNTSDTSTMSSERLAQYWIEGICMPCISFAGLIGSYNIFDHFYYLIRYLNYMYYIFT